ncbi:DUF6332 family protein [Streptomyces sp. NPDC090306]|uniref:DUF6332 family protein n=1 Tax=unclassified Streptomyces TaxID=2593676 RepID=UPI0036F1123D
MSTRRHDQARRDATTVEIGYALASACLLAGLVFAVVAGPVLVWDLPRAAERNLPVAGAWAAGALAVCRVVHVLRRYARERR